MVDPTIDVLVELRSKGNTRRDRWHTPDTEPWTGADWSNAMCGEAGEAANVVKKIRRIETGTGAQDQPCMPELIHALAWELADTIAYADLLAQHYGIDLRAAIADKFNHVSQREGFPERIEIDEAFPPDRSSANAALAPVEALIGPDDVFIANGTKIQRVVEQRNGYTVTRSAVWVEDLRAAVLAGRAATT